MTPQQSGRRRRTRRTAGEVQPRGADRRARPGNGALRLMAVLGCALLDLYGRLADDVPLLSGHIGRETAREYLRSVTGTRAGLRSSPATPRGNSEQALASWAAAKYSKKVRWVKA